MINVTMSGNEDMSVAMSGDEEISTSMTETVVIDTRNHDELNHRDYASQHPMSAITGLVDALDDKADIEDVPTKTSELTNDSGFITSVAWTDILNKPQTFTPSAHTHTKSEITDFPVIPTVPTKLSGFQDDLGSNPVHTHSQYLTEHQSLSGYATQSWVEGKGYLTEHQSLSGYATQTWVGQQGFLTSHQDISGKEDKSNKKTSITSSSTDTDYPSAKAVYDFVGKGTLTIQRNGSTVDTFSANQNTNKTININGIPDTMIFNSLTADSWISDSTYSGFVYKCDIALSGVTSGMSASVVFGLNEALSGYYAPVCDTNDGYVSIYSKIDTSITIPTITVWSE